MEPLITHDEWETMDNYLYEQSGLPMGDRLALCMTLDKMRWPS